MTSDTFLPETEVRLAFGMLMLYIALRFIFTSSSEAALAAAGLFAAGLAWAGYLGLRLLGRRHLSRPRLEDKLREAESRPLRKALRTPHAAPDCTCRHS